MTYLLDTNAISDLMRAAPRIENWMAGLNQMASQTKGRYKHFNQKQNIASLSELREVFDNIILWIIEGMGLIDSNQHTRLKSCFEMRCQCAHPGEAPITEYNLMSFFSDIQKIVLENSAFTV